MAYYNYNGKLFSEQEKIIGPQNRGLRYGDGLFETIKCKRGNLVLFDRHYERLITGMQLLHFDIPKIWSADRMTEEIIALAEKNGLKDARIRINIIRGDGGLYDPENNHPAYIIEAMPLPATGSLNENGLQLCIYRDAIKAAGKFSGIKNNNSLPYLTGAFFAKEKKCNDAVILNQSGYVCETTISNIFLLGDGVIKTPAITEGCVAGIMRRWLTEELKKEGYTVEEGTVTIDELMNADEVFLSNSMYNMGWVKSTEEKEYSNRLCTEIFHLLQKKHPEVIC